MTKLSKGGGKLVAVGTPNPENPVPSEIPNQIERKLVPMENFNVLSGTLCRSKAIKEQQQTTPGNQHLHTTTNEN
jgi:hypothetical protein